MAAINLQRMGKPPVWYVKIAEMFDDGISAPIATKRKAQVWARTLLLGHRELVRLGRQILEQRNA